MHKRFYVNRIVKAAMRRGLVTGVVVHVGELAPLPADELRDALVAATQWDVVVDERPATVRCSCTYEGRPKLTEKGVGLNVYHCPACGRPSPQTVDGRDIVLAQVRVKGDEEDSILDLLLQLPGAF